MHGKPPPEPLQRQRLAQHFGIRPVRATCVDDLSTAEVEYAICQFEVEDQIAREQAGGALPAALDDDADL